MLLDSEDSSNQDPARSLPAPKNCTEPVAATQWIELEGSPGSPKCRGPCGKWNWKPGRKITNGITVVGGGVEGGPAGARIARVVGAALAAK